MMDGPPPLNQFWSPKKIVRALARVLEAEIAFKMLGKEDAVDKAKTKEAMYQACFTKAQLFGAFPNLLNTLPTPKYAIKHWEEDKELARQFLCGVNPVMIEVAKELDQLSDNIVEHFGEERLQDLVDEKRLFFVSYDDLADLQANPHQAYPLPMNDITQQNQERYVYAPIVAFVLDKVRKELDILGIQLERTPDARVYTRDSSSENEWLFVKSCLTTADSNMHEWVSHLGNTHLTMEPHIIAIYNTLRKANHPLYTFLQPLCKDTLLLNCKLCHFKLPILFYHRPHFCFTTTSPFIQGPLVEVWLLLKPTPLGIFSRLLALDNSCNSSARCGHGTASSRSQVFLLNLQAEDLTKTSICLPISTVKME